MAHAQQVGKHCVHDAADNVAGSAYMCWQSRTPATSLAHTCTMGSYKFQQLPAPAKLSPCALAKSPRGVLCSCCPRAVAKLRSSKETTIVILPAPRQNLKGAPTGPRKEQIGFKTCCCGQRLAPVDRVRYGSASAVAGRAKAVDPQRLLTFGHCFNRSGFSLSRARGHKELRLGDHDPAMESAG